MPHKYSFDHRLPGMTIMLGVVAVAAGTVLPWLDSKSRVNFGIDLKVLTVGTQPAETFGGFSEGAGPLLVAVIAVDVLALLVAVALMATHQRRGLFWRLTALVCGLSSGAFGALFVAMPTEDARDVFDTISRAVVSVKPGLGAYLLTFGGLVVVVGALVPGKRSQPLEPA